MLVSTYHLSDTERSGARRHWVTAQPILIGSASDCHVVIDDPEVAPHHLRLISRDDKIIAENLVDELTAIVEEGEPIRIGGTIVKVRLQAQPVVTTMPPPVPPPHIAVNPPMPTANPPGPRPPPARDRPRGDIPASEPEERQLLLVLRANPADADARMVYADWLEGHGLTAKANMVRLREHLDTFMYRNATKPEWRVIAARTPIERCGGDRCPGTWDGLVPNEATDHVRKCASCSRDVRYCVDRGDVQSLGGGAPVVFDAGLDRVAAHRWYEDWHLPLDDDDDDDGYTIDTPPVFKR